MRPAELLIDALATFAHDDVQGDFAAVLASNLRTSGSAGASSVAECLLASVGGDAERRAILADFIGHAARVLAPDDDAPAGGAAEAAWSALVSVAHSLHGSGAYGLGRLPFIRDGLFRKLLGEAREQLSSVSGLGASRAIGKAGNALAALAVSRQLREAVSRTVGFAATPTYDALYEYDPPGSHVRTHIDSRGYDIVFHLILEHTTPLSGEGRSVLNAHLPNAATRIQLSPREAVVLRGRGTLHSWRALGEGEARILTAIGFRAAD